MGTGQKLWKRAKEVIPGGNMLLSKRAEMFLPQQWPAYFKRSSGCRVWDLDEREYLDVGLMGVGTNILGYANEEVDEAVHQTINAGIMSTLNCPEEVYLAERLVEMHPWAEMVRFARSGGEANAVAVRIARAATGRDKIVICGYHGWHDWYLSANLGDEKGLDGHLLPGLEPNGVPRNLSGTVLPLVYGDRDRVRELCSQPDVAALVMEVSRSTEPDREFLEFVRTETRSAGIVLVFDECTSGFRESFGGLHLTIGVQPDLAMFGKALGNGYAITAVIGRRDVMESAQSTFISSTFWTERIGPAAAIKTLEVMQREESWVTVTSVGRRVRQIWQSQAEMSGLSISVGGLTALSTISFDGDQSLELKTLMTQEMLRRGYLATTAFYASISHTEDVLSAYETDLSDVFKLLAECQRRERDVLALLEGPVCHSGFKRLN
jgi:glutamate-1-semialdehyde 2,1-aminomutase